RSTAAHRRRVAAACGSIRGGALAVAAATATPAARTTRTLLLRRCASLRLFGRRLAPRREVRLPRLEHALAAPPRQHLTHALRLRVQRFEHPVRAERLDQRFRRLPPHALVAVYHVVDDRLCIRR